MVRSLYNRCKRNQGILAKSQHLQEAQTRYRRHTGQVSMLDNPEFFGSLPLDPNNRWIKLSKQIPWHEFDLKYRENFKSKKGQPACDSRMALGAVLLKPAYKGLSEISPR